MMSTLSLVFRRLKSNSVENLGRRLKELNDRKEYSQVIRLFNDKDEQQNTNSLVINQVLRASIEMRDFQRGKEIHRNLSSILKRNHFIQTNLIRLYAESNDLNKAKEIFAQTKEKTSAVYTTMIKALIDNDLLDEALELIQQIDVPLNDFLLNSIFGLCSSLRNSVTRKLAEDLFNKYESNIEKNPILLTSALNMFLRFGDIERAENLFSRIKTSNLITLGTMINGLILNGKPRRALEIFDTIRKPNEFLYSMAFKACAEIGSTEGLRLGEKILSKENFLVYRSSHVHQSILNMFIKCEDQQKAIEFFNKPEKCLSLFERMKAERITADSIIYTLVIDACSQIGDFELSRSIVSQIPDEIVKDPWIEVGLIDMWGKVGSIEDARRIFHSIKAKNKYSSTAMIHAYGLNGEGAEAVRIFSRLPKEFTDQQTIVCVLNACSHCGLQREAEKIFSQLGQKERCERVFTAMVDMYSRLFLFDEARRMIEQYEKEHAPSIPMYMTVLSSARTKKNTQVSQRIYDEMSVKFGSSDAFKTSAKVLLANVYASNVDQRRASTLRMELNSSGLKKLAGVSWTVINGKIHTFRAHDRSHPDSEKIYAELDRLTEELKENGYRPDGSWITRPLMNDESEETVLCGHSERLAIAFNLLQKPNRSRIQIVKNLRVCGDCHEATKLIAKIRQCLIVVRDANRIHHFYPDGHCSCNDHF